MPKQINTPTPGQRLVRLFGLKGRFQPVLDEVIVPVVDVGAEEVERRHVSAQGTAAAGAGAYSFAWLANFDLSSLEWTGKIITLDRITIHATAADDYWWILGGTYTAGAITDLAGTYTDTEFAGQTPLASVQYGRTTTDNSASAIFKKWVAAGGVTINFSDWILSNGLTIMVQRATANLAFDFTIEWWEQDVVAATN